MHMKRLNIFASLFFLHTYFHTWADVTETDRIVGAIEISFNQITRALEIFPQKISPSRITRLRFLRNHLSVSITLKFNVQMARFI